MVINPSIENLEDLCRYFGVQKPSQINRSLSSSDSTIAVVFRNDVMFSDDDKGWADLDDNQEGVKGIRVCKTLISGEWQIDLEFPFNGFDLDEALTDDSDEEITPDPEDVLRESLKRFAGTFLRQGDWLEDESLMETAAAVLDRIHESNHLSTAPDGITYEFRVLIPSSTFKTAEELQTALNQAVERAAVLNWVEGNLMREEEPVGKWTMRQYLKR